MEISNRSVDNRSWKEKRLRFSTFNFPLPFSTLNTLSLLLISTLHTPAFSQQLPIYTQFVSDELYFNPAIAGTKKTYDIRLNYRDQWVGFDGAPVTEGISFNYSFKGRMGFAGYVYEDVTGFTRRTNYSLCYAYHVTIKDVTLSLGLGGSMMRYMVDGSQITTNQVLDPAIDRTVVASAWSPDASCGFYLYSQKWRFGLSADNLISNDINLYKSYNFPADTSQAGKLQMFTHAYGYLSNINMNNETFTWQNSLFFSYVAGTPIYLAYDLRCYINNRFYAGAELRLNDAIAINLGFIIKETFEFAYSYDFVTSQISHFSSGSHEATLIYSFDGKNSANGARGSGDKSFGRRKYQYMF